MRIQQHLTDVPEYIVPPTLKNLAGISKRGTKRKREHYRTSESSAIKFQVFFITIFIYDSLC